MQTCTTPFLRGSDFLPVERGHVLNQSQHESSLASTGTLEKCGRTLKECIKGSVSKRMFGLKQLNGINVQDYSKFLDTVEANVFLPSLHGTKVLGIDTGFVCEGFLSELKGFPHLPQPHSQSTSQDAHGFSFAENPRAFISIRTPFIYLLTD
jgi:hypothetical protein